MNPSDFIFVTCQLGAETALKHELGAAHPELRLAYSRPGFITFKIGPEKPAGAGVRLHSVFARSWGLSLGRVVGEEPGALAAGAWRLAAGRVFDALHVWQRDTGHVGLRGFEPQPTPDAGQAAALLEATRPAEFAQLPINAPLARGHFALDCILVEPNEWWVGFHRAESIPARYPGGLIPVEAHPEMASRAYLKMKEALAWSEFACEPGEVCVELGSAPGGASQALLELGMQVRGVDPAAMAPQVLAHPNFTHVQMRGADLKRREYADVDWLAVDVNLTPAAMLRVVEPIVTHELVNIRGLLLTLKLHKRSFVDRLPDYLEQIRSWGYDDTRAWQMAHNRQEICVAAFKSTARRKRVQRKSARRRRRA